MLLAVAVSSNLVFGGSLPNSNLRGLAATPQGFIGAAKVNAIGEALIPMIQGTSQFEQLSKGTTYKVTSQSFGYSWGPKGTHERVILFSPDNTSYIVAEVALPEQLSNVSDNFSTALSTDISKSQIQNMYLVMNNHISFGTSSGAYGGYGANFGLFGSTLSEAYGNIQVPSKISKPSTGCSDNACAVFGEWTGVSIGSGGANLTQGGVAWFGFNVTPPSNSVKGWSLFVERIPSSGSGTAVLFKPPSGFVPQGNTIAMKTEPIANCLNGGDQWWQYWTIGSTGTSQEIGCDPNNLAQGWFIFESPGPCSGRGCFDSSQFGYVYQIPEFSSVSFTGNICNNVGTCSNINSDTNGVYYIQHNSQDTSTSSISGGSSGSWTESWLSSS